MGKKDNLRLLTHCSTCFVFFVVVSDLVFIINIFQGSQQPFAYKIPENGCSEGSEESFERTAKWPGKQPLWSPDYDENHPDQVPSCCTPTCGGRCSQAVAECFTGPISPWWQGEGHGHCHEHPGQPVSGGKCEGQGKLGNSPKEHNSLWVFFLVCYFS